MKRVPQEARRHRALLQAAAVVLCGAAVHGATHALTLVSEGRPVSRIVIAANPTCVAQLAAHELQHHVRLITGAEVPIVRGAAPGTGTPVLVGPSAAAERLGLSGDAFGAQEYLIRFLPDALVLMGRDSADSGEVVYSPEDPFAFRTWPGLFEDQGTLHAVYDFLERFCDVRWYTPTEVGTDCPTRATLTVSGGEVRRSPAFLYRDLGWIMGMSENYDAVTALWPRESPELKAYEAEAYSELHERFPNRWHYIHAKRGQVRLFLHRMRVGGEKYQANHSFYGYYARYWEKDPKQPELFIEKRPDWFARGYEGKPPQMCYSNPEFIRQVVDDARQYFDGKGKAPRAVAQGDFFALVPMDNSSYCRCEACQALRHADEDDSPFFSNGLWSDYVFGFANRVAREVERTHPDKYLATLAYASYARHLRRTRLERNIAVQLCLHVRNTYDRALQQNDLDIFRSWVAREKDRPIYLWLYYCFPAEQGHRGGWHAFPGFFAHHVVESFRMYQRHGVRGAFFNGFGQDVDAFVTFECLDDPSRGADELLGEYFDRYFGAAAEPMKAFYLAVESAYGDPGNYPVAQQDGRLLPVGHQTEEMAWGSVGTPERMAKLGELMARARGLARTDVEQRRVRLFEMGTWEYMRAGPRRVSFLERPESPGLPARLERLLYRPPAMAPDDAVQGRPFHLETPGSYFAWQGKTRPGKGNPLTALTDGGTSESVFFFHPKPVAIVARCDLGVVPPAGRELRELRVCWTMADSQRSRANVKFAVRDAETGDWRDVTGFLKVGEWEKAKPDSYMVLSVPFGPGAVGGFDAVRMVDGAHLIGVNPTRFTEVDVVTARPGP